MEPAPTHNYNQKRKEMIHMDEIIIENPHLVVQLDEVRKDMKRRGIITENDLMTEQDELFVALISVYEATKNIISNEVKS